MAARPRLAIATPADAEAAAPGEDAASIARQGAQLLTDGLARFAPEAQHGVCSSRYELGETLGRGAYSVVRACVDTHTGERLAAKIIAKGQFAHRPAALRRLRDEARVLRALRHPRVVALRDIVETPTELYLLMERADGGELFDAVVARGAFSEDDAARVAAQLLEVFTYILYTRAPPRAPSLDMRARAARAAASRVLPLACSPSRSLSRGDEAPAHRARRDARPLLARA